MRKQQVAQAVLCDRGIAYVITDRELTVVEVGQADGDLQTWLSGWLGRPLVEVVPELIGSEDALNEVLAGRLSRFQIPYINRELPGRDPAYLTMIDLPCHDDAGRIVGLIHVIQDVSEVGRLEQRLAQQRNELRLLQEELRRRNLALEAANAELRRSDQMKSTFVSIAAHELRTPLASISGYVEMLLDGDAGALTERQREYLQLVEGSARRLLRITRDLLDLTRIEAGRIEITLRPTDLVELVDDVADELVPQLAAKEQHLCR
ncbi:MAG: histidine kinase dimerization/phospho-acceptor domain-containing protein, partial [Anaerolineae bacterium]